MTASTSLEQPDLPPSYRQEIESILLEIRKLWKGVRGGDNSRLYDQPFTLAGPVYVSESPRWYLPNFGGRLVRAVVSLDTPGTTDTIVVIRVNGDPITGGTITIPGGADVVFNQSVDVYLSGDSDYVQVAVTTAGAGAEDLTVQLRFSMA